MGLHWRKVSLGSRAVQHWMSMHPFTALMKVLSTLVPCCSGQNEKHNCVSRMTLDCRGVATEKQQKHQEVEDVINGALPQRGSTPQSKSAHHMLISA